MARKSETSCRLPSNAHGRLKPREGRNEEGVYDVVLRNWHEGCKMVRERESARTSTTYLRAHFRGAVLFT